MRVRVKVSTTRRVPCDPPGTYLETGDSPCSRTLRPPRVGAGTAFALDDAYGKCLGGGPRKDGG